MKGIFLGLSTAVFFSFSSAYSYGNTFGSETKEFEATKILKLDVSNPKGEILIQTSQSNTKKILVSIEKIHFDKQCRFTMGESLSTLSLKVDQQNALFDKVNCETKLKIEIPAKAMDIEVSSGSAAISLLGINGNVNFRTATGSVTIKGDALKNIEGKTATGPMRFSFNKCSARADIDLVSATGDAEIILPSTCKIKVSHKSATGDLFNELGESEDFQVRITSKSASGALKLKKLSK